ncbi:MAG: YvcK family protein [Candidatus Eremiobacterota bacterium]
MKNKHIELYKHIKVVVIGGGTGLSTLLRGLKHYTEHITAIVTVSDDGGSSGRLRKDMGIIPPGDIRNCLVALSASESLLADLFQYRFHNVKDLEGHNFGNLFLVALSEVAGDFDKAIKECSKVLAIKGKVLPATLDTVVLMAEMEDRSIIEGETNITSSKGIIRKVFLKPHNPKPQHEVIEALREADAIIFGPGSLYTSVIPNLLVSEICNNIKTSQAIKIYICNVMTQPGETDGFTAGDHIKAIFAHTGYAIFDYVLLNKKIPNQLLDKYQAQGAYPVDLDLKNITGLGVNVITDDLISETDLVRHNSDKLARAILELSVKS